MQAHAAKRGRSRIGRHAVVIGGGIAGLLAARVLVSHFEQVTVLERDALEDAPDPRKGTPQARHVHGLLDRGRSILEQLFPGILDELIAGGSTCMDTSRDVAWYHAGCWKLR